MFTCSVWEHVIEKKHDCFATMNNVMNEMKLCTLHSTFLIADKYMCIYSTCVQLCIKICGNEKVNLVFPAAHLCPKVALIHLLIHTL